MTSRLIAWAVAAVVVIWAWDAVPKLFAPWTDMGKAALSVSPVLSSLPELPAGCKDKECAP